MTNQPPAGDAELPIKDLILELLGACGRLSTEQITNLVNLIGKREKAQREALTTEINAAVAKELQKIQMHMVTHEYDIPMDKRLDDYLTNRIAALHQLKDPERS